MNRIIQLDDEVVRRIAAGEVLERPVNAVKELLENSLDAQATRITVSIEVPATGNTNGLYSLEITDNGEGIVKEDLELLCARHATSKLSQVEDLRSLGTFGFRGEALASCSQVGRVQVITKRRDSPVAWRATYLNGKMTPSEATPTHGNDGTILSVRDLFYNNRVRREEVAVGRDEYLRILKVVQAYAIEQAGRVAFTLSRINSNGNSGSSNCGQKQDLNTTTSFSRVDAVRAAFGDPLANALLPFTAEASPNLGIERVEGWASRTTFHGLKAPNVIFFLNGRLIEHLNLRRALLAAFSSHLPTSPPAHPFLFVSWRMRPNMIDVNIHPSKRQVCFLDEEEVIKYIVGAVQAQVLERQYESQPMQPVVVKSTPISRDVKTVHSLADVADGEIIEKKKPNSVVNGKISALYPSRRVLVDNTNHRIDTFLFHHRNQVDENRPPIQNQSSPILSKEREIDSSSQEKVSSPLMVSSPINKGWSPIISSMKRSRPSLTNMISPLAAGEESNFEELKESDKSIIEQVVEIKSNIEVREASNSIESVQTAIEHRSNELALLKQYEPALKQIQDWIESQAHPQINDLLADSSVVGLINPTHAMIQSRTYLILADPERLAFEMFYSLVLLMNRDAGGCEILWLSTPISIRQAVVEHYRGSEGAELDALIKDAGELLAMQSILLRQLFGVCIETATENEDWLLTGVPLLIPGQRVPPPVHLSTFVIRLCLAPEWSVTEEESDAAIEGKQVYLLKSIAREVSMLLALIDQDQWPDWQDYLKFVILPALKSPQARFTKTNCFLNPDARDEAVDSSRSLELIQPPLQIITDTHSLYKNFERC